MHSHGPHTQRMAMRIELALSDKVRARRAEAEVEHQAARRRGARLTLSELTRLLPDLSVMLLDGEYRINFKRGKEATAYYTNDVGDALETGRDMLKRKWLSEHNVRQS